jgi:hypothetical protein
MVDNVGMNTTKGAKAMTIKEATNKVAAGTATFVVKQEAGSFFVVHQPSNLRVGPSVSRSCAWNRAIDFTRKGWGWQEAKEEVGNKIVATAMQREAGRRREEGYVNQ